MAILTYHHIGDCPPEQADHPGLWVSEEAFGRQLSWLARNGWRGVSLDEVEAAIHGRGKLPRKWVAVTFDDGWRDNYTRALPLLAAHQFPATIFMVSSKVRTGPPSGAWDEYLSASEIQEMAARGIVFGSHTRSHPRLTKLSDEQVREELDGSREELAPILGAAPRWLCYPYGSFSPRIARLAREAGYRGALSTIRDNRVRLDQLYWMPRVMVMGDTTPARLRYMLSGLYHIVHSLKNRKRWRSIRSG